MNTHKFNMYAAAIIGSLLTFLLLGFFSDLIYGGRAGHGDEPLAFAVEVAETGESAGGGEVDWSALVAAADTANGEKVFKKCTACHKVEDGANAVGPHLWGVVGRDIASVAGYSFSDALAGMDGVWDLQNLSHFLESPKSFAPGTKMGFAGIGKAQDRVDVIAYLNNAAGSPIELAAAPSGGETVAAAGGTEAAATDAAADAASGTAETGTATATTEAPATSTETAAAPATEAPATEAPATEAPATTEAPAAGTETAAAPTTEGAATSEPAAAGGTTGETSSGAATGTETAAAPAAGSGDFASLAASGDAAAGEKVFRKCRACHKVEEGKNGVGPSLWGVVGRNKGSVEGFKYSDAMASAGGAWTGSDLNSYLEDPKGFIPGNKMTFPGLKDAQDRVNVIIYLNEADGSPEPLQ